MVVITDAWWWDTNRFTATTMWSFLVSAIAVWQFSLMLVKLTIILYQQRFWMISFSLSHQLHLLSNAPRQRHSHNSLQQWKVKTSVMITGIHSAGLMSWSSDVYLFKPIGLFPGPLGGLACYSLSLSPWQWCFWSLLSQVSFSADSRPKG